MLSEREIRRLHEIEVQLRRTDPRMVRRFSALTPRGRPRITWPGSAGLLPSALLGFSLMVLLIGAVAVNVPTVIAGIVMAALALGVAAMVGPEARSGPA